MQKILLLIVILFSNTVLSNQEYEKIYFDKILEIEINSSINPATYNYLSSGFEKAKKDRANFILITMNTPGGLVSTTKEILTLFGESEIPIIVWVKPEGASATSAGAIISSGAHLLFMSSGTNIGAAAPVMMGKDIDPKGVPTPLKDRKKDEKSAPSLENASDMKKKAVNDLMALVKSLSQARGRNADKFGEMISKASSFTSSEALESKIIDGLANNYDDLRKNSLGKIIEIKGEKKIISSQLESPIFIRHNMDIGQSILNVLANPSLAYILFIIGAALLYFELQAPGGFIAGATGVVFIILAAIGFQVLPLNFGALGLIILAFLLFILEVFVTSFGMLSVAGVISLILGSLFLFRAEEGHVSLPISVIASVVGGIVCFLVFIGYFLIRDLRRVSQRTDHYNLTNKKGRVILARHKDKNDFWHYSVKINGEIWDACSKDHLDIEDPIIVSRQYEDQMTLEIKRA
jgi:membrane-bound serine protease (ClpP class)